MRNTSSTPWLSTQAVSTSKKIQEGESAAAQTQSCELDLLTVTSEDKAAFFKLNPPVIRLNIKLNLNDQGLHLLTADRKPIPFAKSRINDPEDLVILKTFRNFLDRKLDRAGFEEYWENMDCALSYEEYYEKQYTVVEIDTKKFKN